MRILALEPYYGGSHKAFLDGWIANSRHDWTVVSLPPHKWKWRMRHSAETFESQVRDMLAGGATWDVLFCSDMLNLAEFRGLSPATIFNLPSIAYFHENQITYPVRHESERDYHFGYTNMTTALAASRVWFNSAFNRDSFLTALPGFLDRMPDHQTPDAVQRIESKAEVFPPGISPCAPREQRRAGPLRILWAARWEHDKNPTTFFDAIELLEKNDLEFRLSVIGEQFIDKPAVFESAAERFAGRIDHWGFQPSREKYFAVLRDADVIVSTADHEFFGLSVVEAIASGAYPLLPNRLSYPEILRDCGNHDREAFLYDGSAQQLAERSALLANRMEAGELWTGDATALARAMRRFTWEVLAPRLDHAIERVG